MLPPDTIQALARELSQARKTRTALRHFSQRTPSMTIDDGYAIQRAWVALEWPTGARSRAARSASPRARCSCPARSTSPTTRR
jgi:2-keto-4-pentenoate hydratase